MYLLDFDSFNAFYFKIYQFLDPSLLLNINYLIYKASIFEKVDFSLTVKIKGQQN